MLFTIRLSSFRVSYVFILFLCHDFVHHQRCTETLQSQISIPLACHIATEIEIFQKQCSDFHILTLFIGQKLRKQQLIPYFFSTNHLLSAKQKHSKRCIFTRKSKNPRTTLGLLKNPRSREKSLGLATMPPCWTIKVRFYPIIF